MSDIFQAQYPYVSNQGYIAMCDISPVDIYGCDTVSAINHQV